MSFFNDLGKILGGVATAIVPGFSTIAKTGIFGDTLQAVAGGGTTPVAQAVASSPGLMASITNAPRPTVAPTVAGRAPLSGQTVAVPREFMSALVQENRRLRGVYVPPAAVSAIAPRMAVTPLQTIAARTPTSPALSTTQQFSPVLGIPIPPGPTHLVGAVAPAPAPQQSWLSVIGEKFSGLF